MKTETDTIAVAQIVPQTEAEGPGVRFALWVQGCPLRCPGCCNPEFLAFKNSTAIPTADVIAALDRAITNGVEGISLLGGEPFAHAANLVTLARHAHQHNLGVMVYSGYTLAELQTQPDAQELLALTDILVDGPYDRQQPERHRRWIGSLNQQMHFLTPRYNADDECWKKPNTLEIRLNSVELTINGFPADAAKSLWKGWRRNTAMGSKQ